MREGTAEVVNELAGLKIYPVGAANVLLKLQHNLSSTYIPHPHTNPRPLADPTSLFLFWSSVQTKELAVSHFPIDCQ